MERVNAWKTYDLELQKECLDFAEDYRRFISENKTERECVDTFVNLAEDAGYVELPRLIEENARTGRQLQPGDKVYMTWMNKSMILFRLGSRPLEEGLNILGAHIDNPRMDVKQDPMYEKGGLGYLDTHYYGGIKTYQFVARALAIHGVVVKKNGETVVLNVGEDPDDPVFFVSDILIHLAKNQMTKTAAEAVSGEALDVVIGSKPLIIDADTKRAGEEGGSGNASCPSADSEGASSGSGSAADAAKEAVKSALLEILKEQYGFEEEDFASAELEVVPAGPARDAGFDRSMILGYGHDDRSCAYPSFRAIMDAAFDGGDNAPVRTSVCLLVDKEEIGSVGATGMQARYFENAVAEVMNLCGQYSDLSLRRCLADSCMLSNDVNAGYDPCWAECFDEKNSAFLGCGVSFMKFTGSGGKSFSNDANAEYLAHLRDIFDREGIVYQTSELGKVDAGGGGTIAYIPALYGMNVVDTGVPVLSMHSPAEACSKADLFEAYRGYKAFLKDANLRNS